MREGFIYYGVGISDGEVPPYDKTTGTTYTMHSASRSRGSSTVQTEIDSFTEPEVEVQFRVELPESRYETVLRNSLPQPQNVMVNFSDAERVVKKYGGFEDVLKPHHNLTITGTEYDSIVAERTKYDELNLFEELDRRVRYVPDYSWVYGWMSKKKQMEAVRIQLRNLIRLFVMKEEREWDNVEVLPLVKGISMNHYARFIDLFDEWDIDRYAIYVVQEVQEVGLQGIIERVRRSITALDPDGVLVIGIGSPNWIEKLPPRVDGIASLRRWKMRCGLDKDGYSTEGLHMWHYEVKRSLEKYSKTRQIQTRLNKI